VYRQGEWKKNKIKSAALGGIARIDVGFFLF
jgi:hypothetical protein